jgi:hypothetical protein
MLAKGPEAPRLIAPDPALLTRPRRQSSVATEALPLAENRISDSNPKLVMENTPPMADRSTQL